MSTSDEVDLQSLFVTEIDERGARLSEGARQLLQAPLEADELATMVREGHTIKGTARMMGYTAVSDAAKLLEDGWRCLRDGEVEPSPELAESLLRLTAELVEAVDADPATGTPGLAAGMRALRGAMLGEPVNGSVDDVAGEEKAAVEAGDLHGLLGTIGSLGFGEVVRVDAAKLYRLINELCSLRVDVDVLADLVATPGKAGPNDAEARRLRDMIAEVRAAVADLQGRAVDLAAVPLGEVTATYTQLVRYVARRAGKDLKFVLEGEDVVADRQVIERLSEPLRHLLVNAVEHGIEPVEERVAKGKPGTAALTLHAEGTGQRLVVTVEDDGRGVDWDRVQRTALERGLLDPEDAEDPDALRAVLFSKDFSTAPVGELVGGGIGLPLVAEAVESLQGSLTFDTEEGAGTKVVITVPRSRALQDAVLVTEAGQTWGLPALSVLESLAVERSPVRELSGRPVVAWGGFWIPVVSFAEALGLTPTAEPGRVLVVSTTSGPVAFLVEDELERRQVAARELGPVLSGVPHLTGAALLGGGDVIVIVDPSRLAERARVSRPDQAPRHKVLVVDDSRGARQIVGGALGSAGFEVDLAGSPTEALSVLAEAGFDAIVLDYLMPTMDGATLAAKIRELGIDAPIVMLSGVATADDQARAAASGANAYLDKDDVRKGALTAVLRELIG